MAQLFHPATNTLARWSIFVGAAIALGLVWLIGAIYRSSYVTRTNVVRAQPVQFSHKHHVSGLGIDCRYCHPSVESGAFAGMPATETCMHCHAYVWADSPMLAPVRESYRSGTPIAWTRVHDLPDFTYFDHGIHVAKGIGCVSCHGRVDQMPLMWKHASLFMEWCLECHRNPEPHVRPRESVFAMEIAAPADRAERRALLEAHRIETVTDCSICHR